MARRIEIELTSDRGDGTWTWRAAGAREPKGTLEAGLLPASAGVGDVLRAEVEGFLDGLNIVAILAPKASRSEPERIELLAPRSEGPLVTSRVSRTSRGEGARGRRSDRGDRDRGDRGDRGDRDRPRGPRRPRSEGDDRRRERPAPPPVETKPKPRRLRPGKAHRSALLEALPAEQRPIAEQLLQGGIPAVRQAIEKQNQTLKAEGKSQVSPEPLLEVAEKLRHRAQAAVWRDRADAALAHVDDLDLRDLRSVVNAAGDAGRDSEARDLAEQLREALINRVEKEQAAWVEEVAENLREGRVVRALRLSSRPPKAGQPLPPDLSEQLVVATSQAMTAETGSQRWSTVLDALAYSPIRRRVVPESLPTKLSPDLRTMIARLADRLPEIAHIFDIEPASPKDRARPPRPRPRKGGPGGAGGAGGGKDGGGKKPAKGKGGDKPAAAKAGAAPAEAETEPPQPEAANGAHAPETQPGAAKAAGTGSDAAAAEPKAGSDTEPAPAADAANADGTEAASDTDTGTTEAASDTEPAPAADTAGADDTEAAPAANAANADDTEAASDIEPAPAADTANADDTETEATSETEIAEATAADDSEAASGSESGANGEAHDETANSVSATSTAD